MLEIHSEIMYSLNVRHNNANFVGLIVSIHQNNWNCTFHMNTRMISQFKCLLLIETYTRVYLNEYCVFRYSYNQINMKITYLFLLVSMNYNKELFQRKDKKFTKP